jgi:heat shock protein HtpX
VLEGRIRQRQHLRNAVQGLLLLAGMLAVMAVLALLVLGADGLLWVLGLGVLLLAFRPKVPPQWVLSMYGARPIAEAAAPDLHRYVAVLAERAGLPKMPQLYYVATPMTNAFALGRPDDSVLAVTDGLLRRLSSREVAGVLAHEVSHIRSDDLWIMTLSDSVGRLTHGLAYTGVLLLLTVPWTAGNTLRPLAAAVTLALLPTVVTLLQLALSRSREYDADLEGAALTSDPEGLAQALEELERSAGQTWERTMVPRGRVPDPLLLRTHPPTKDRIRRLRELIRPDEHRQLGGDQPLAPSGYPPVRGRARLRAPGIRW